MMIKLLQRKFSIIFLLFLVCFSKNILAEELVYQVHLPPYSKIISPDIKLQSISENKQLLILPEDIRLPFEIEIQGPLGGIVKRKITDLNQLHNLNVESRIIYEPNPNPRTIHFLPKLCPRVFRDPLSSMSDPTFYYDAHLDKLNKQPFFQSLDPDFFDSKQYKVISEMDGKNVLQIKKVIVKYDYEDDTIIDYEGPHPKTGKPHIVFEGQGGFYGNLHYAVMPFDSRILKLNRQDLLHLVQGKLKDINRNELKPSLRSHSFIPGPFLSGKKINYDLCEWGDTTYQAPEQKLSYKNFVIWDWDYSVSNNHHIILVVWEGDEEEWMYQQKMLNPFYLTDDLVGIFEIKRMQTLSPLTLTNGEKTFEITLETGNVL